MSDKTISAAETFLYSQDNIDLIPSNIELSVSEINLRDEMGSDKILASLLESMKKTTITF
ncbi:AAA family ATPase [Cohnella sp. REN36]|uniref:AAA family ATPase n=1 Tax=Cohnella sp. REN36 TaxID=2887347 RepID=UPI001D1495C2|nr:AAA family ATPase [Cohnella sp. REN36]MCC3372082.1 AAA family ATPase [Cohnella sp. REN36]